jgi:hypothetical protein
MEIYLELIDLLLRISLVFVKIGGCFLDLLFQCGDFAILLRQISSVPFSVLVTSILRKLQGGGFGGQLLILLGNLVAKRTICSGDVV